MTTQLSLDNFTRTHARRENPDTSKQAAQSMATSAAEAQCREIRAVLVQYGPATAEGISRRCDLDRVQVGRRLSDLKRKGWARPTDRREVISTGRKAVVWEALP